MGIFAIASQHNQWLSSRQSVLAENIANANTPGYKAQDLEPFAAGLGLGKLDVSATHSEHFQLLDHASAATGVRETAALQSLHSGSTVRLEQEMIKAGEVNRAFALNASVVKTFHRLFLTAAKG